MKELRLEELLVIDGGACTWRGAIGYTALGAVRGAFVGAPIQGGIGGAVGYAATCWW